MMKKASSMPETIPRGPFTSIGFFHTANRFFVPLLLLLIIKIRQRKENNVIHNRNISNNLNNTFMQEQ